MNKGMVKRGIVEEWLEPLNCRNSTYECSLPLIEGYGYCIKHILQDPSAPYKQCNYIYPSNGKQCTQAKLDEKHDG